MNEQLITFDTAKLAKEKGFEDRISGYYNREGILQKHFGLIGAFCKAPTQSLLQKWLREVHETDIMINHRRDEIKHYYQVYIQNSTGGYSLALECKYNTSHSPTCFSTYEQALEKGLQKALNLVKRKMIKEIIKYQTDDGCVFNSLSDAEKYDVLLQTCIELGAHLMTTPEDDMEFNNGVGWLQHPKGTKDRMEKDILTIYNKHFDASKSKIDYVVGRHVNDNNTRCLDRLVERWMSIDNSDREYGQVYYAINPDKAKGGQINGST